MKRLVLAGGGHAHLSVLSAFARSRPKGLELVMVTPHPHQYYSGMLPGFIAGLYQEHACRIALAPLIAAAGARWVQAAVTGMDADDQGLVLSDGQQLDYDLLSLDVGSEVDTQRLALAGPRLLPVKPLDDFYERWRDIEHSASRGHIPRLVVVGGGAAGLEVALAARHRLARLAPQAEVHLVHSESGLLPGHASGVRRHAFKAIHRAGLLVHGAGCTGTESGVLLGDGEHLAADFVIAATGARPLDWLGRSGLASDTLGFVQVDSSHRSLSHAQVFAVGDACSRVDVAMARSGVHAVRAGPILADNLRAAIVGGPLQAYRPRRKSLYLLATGDQRAIASWGRWSAEGAWVWKWKNRIDQGFVHKYQPKPAAPAELASDTQS